jgi:preprotein translocase subunit SecF
VLCILYFFTGTVIAMFNFLLFTGIIYDLVWHGAGCS